MQHFTNLQKYQMNNQKYSKKNSGRFIWLNFGSVATLKAPSHFLHPNNPACNMDYYQQLRHPLWQKKRLAILNRDNFTCQICSDTKTNLQIHHLSYNGFPWETPSSDLITLCENCHKKAEQIKSIPSPETIKQSIYDLQHKLKDNSYSKQAKAVFMQGISLLETELLKSIKVYAE